MFYKYFDGIFYFRINVNFQIHVETIMTDKAFVCNLDRSFFSTSKTDAK